MNLLKLLFLGLLGCAAATASAQPAQDPSESITRLTAIVNSTPEILKPSDSKSLPLFCQISGFRDTNTGPSETSVQASEPLVNSGWSDSFYAVYDYRVSSFLAYFDPNLIRRKVSDIPVSELNRVLQMTTTRIAGNSAEVDSGIQNILVESIDNMMQNESDQSRLLGFLRKGGATYACSEVATLHLRACMKALDSMLTTAVPVSGVTLLSVWKEVLQDPVYMQVYKKVAVKIMARIQTQTAPKDRFFDELKDAFQREVKNPALAEDYAWKTEGLLASGGANVQERTRLIGFPMPELDELLYVLSSGSLVLDRLTAKKGFLYTSPKEVNSLCDNGKSYHFWMAAYPARENSKMNHDPTAAAAAAFSLDKLYQFGSETSGRDPTKPFTQDTFANYSNVIRLDVAQASVGAWYGALSGNSGASQDGFRQVFSSSSPNLLSEAVQAIFDGARRVPKRSLKLDDFSAANPTKLLMLYSTWKKIINPNAAFEVVEKSLHARRTPSSNTKTAFKKHRSKN